MVVNSQQISSPIVGGVIVAYYPEEVQFLKIVKAALNEVDFLVLVNNSEIPIELDKQHVLAGKDNKHLDIIENGENFGIAKALNIGLEDLIKKGCTHFLMLDQDSLVPHTMVKHLLETLDVINTDNNVAAIGPAYFNSRLNKYAPFIQFGNWTLKKIKVNSQPKIIEAHFLISSGTLLTLDAVNNVGLMEESLFIDYVDTEWCFRAIAKGYKLFGFSGVVMEHALGDAPLVLFGKQFPMHSPLRHYYLVRNALSLLKKSYIPINWKFIVFWRMFRSFVFYSLLPSNRFEHLSKMFEGVIDGIHGKLGKYKSNA